MGQRFSQQDFLERKYEDKKLRKAKNKASKVLVIGMGGGCDVFSAYTLAKKVNDGETTGDILYANCISERKKGIPSDHVTLVQNSLYAVPPGNPRPLKHGENTYGTTFLEQSVPRGAGNSPYLLEVKGHRNLETEDDVKQQTEENTTRLHSAWDYLEVDLILSVDTGGDSLTGGKDWKVNKITGRDQQVLHALREYKKKRRGFRFMHIVLGPGCDGETPEEVMRTEVIRSDLDESDLPWCKGRKYLGSFSMKEMIPETFEMVKALAPNRTPFLMYRALVNEGEYTLTGPRPGEEGYQEGRDLVKIERHGNTEVIPRDWLLNGLIFEYKDNFFRGRFSK